MERKGTGSFHIGTRGEGIIYVSKRLLRDFPFTNGEQLKITVREDGSLLIEKL